MVSKSKPSNVIVTVEPSGSVSIHKWWDNAGRFMTFTREEALEVSHLLNKEFHNDQDCPLPAAACADPDIC